MATSEPTPAAKKTEAPKYAPGPNDPKLFNTMIIFDVYTLARDGEQARECVLDWIRNQQLTPSEQQALPVTRDVEIREAWRAEKPFVAADITDAEFESMAKGNTTVQVFQLLYTKKK